MGTWPQRYAGQVPCNHFTLNDEQDCSRAARWLRERLAGSEGERFPWHTTFAQVLSELVVSLIPRYNWCLINSNKVFHLLCLVFQINLQFVVIFDTQHI